MSEDKVSYTKLAESWPESERAERRTRYAHWTKTITDEEWKFLEYDTTTKEWREAFFAPNWIQEMEKLLGPMRIAAKVKKALGV